eukprot:411832-Ditylum_brightwellii.AAC.1
MNIWTFVWHPNVNSFDRRFRHVGLAFRPAFVRGIKLVQQNNSQQRRNMGHYACDPINTLTLPWNNYVNVIICNWAIADLEMLTPFVTLRLDSETIVLRLMHHVNHLCYESCLMASGMIHCDSR